MSKDLFSVHHSYDVNLAVALGGPDLAAFMHHISYWIEFNKRKDKNFHDGRYWMYDTFEELHNHFPYWTVKQLRLIVDKLIKSGVLIKGNYNQNKYDHTAWYSIDYEKVESICPKRQIDNPDPMCPNGQIENLKRENQSAQMGESITHNNTNNTPSVCLSVPPKEGGRNCQKTLCSGEVIEISFDDVITQSILQNCHDWLMEEMEKAWEILVAYQDPIRDWFKFIEGIISKNRLKKHTGNKCQTQSQQTTQTKTETKASEKQSNNINGKSSGKDTSVRILADFWEEYTSKRKFSTS